MFAERTRRILQSATFGALLVAGSLSPDKVIRDTLWAVGFSGLTGTAVLLMRTVAQALHPEPDQPRPARR